MNVTLYTNTSDEHILDKSITQVGLSAVSGTLKEDTNYINPTLILSSSVSDFNYCYIDIFDRYYYVRNKTYSQQRYYYDLEVDVLMSWNSEIKALNVIANRSSSTFNVYQPDNSIPFLQNNIIATQKFPAGFSTQAFVLAVNGD